MTLINCGVRRNMQEPLSNSESNDLPRVYELHMMWDCDHRNACMMPYIPAHVGKFFLQHDTPRCELNVHECGACALND